MAFWCFLFSVANTDVIFIEIYCQEWPNVKISPRKYEYLNAIASHRENLLFFFFSLFSKLAGECTYACTSSNLRLNFWLLTADNYLQYPAIFILGKKYCKQWMDGSGGQGSIAWCIVVLCFSSQWALTLVMYVLLGNYRVWELLPVTRRYQHMQADTWHLSFAAQPSLHRWPCLLFLFLFKIAFFYLLHGGWLCCVTNQPTFYVAVCPICQVALQDCDLPLQVLAMLPVAGQAARGAEREQGFRGACRGGSNAEHTAGGQCSCLVGLGSCCWKLHL